MLVCWSLAGPGWTDPNLSVWAAGHLGWHGVGILCACARRVRAWFKYSFSTRGLICSPSTHHKTVTLGTGKFTGVYYTSQTSLRSSFFFCLFSLLLLRLSLGLGWLGASPWFYWVRAKCRSRPWSTQLGLHLYNIMYSVMQSDGNSFCGDIFLESFNMAYWDEDIFLDQKYEKQMF